MDVVKNSAKLPRLWQRDKTLLKPCTGATTQACAMKNKNSVDAIYSANCYWCYYCTKFVNYCLDIVDMPFPDTLFQIAERIL